MFKDALPSMGGSKQGAKKVAYLWTKMGEWAKRGEALMMRARIEPAYAKGDYQQDIQTWRNGGVWDADDIAYLKNTKGGIPPEEQQQLDDAFNKATGG